MRRSTSWLYVALGPGVVVVLAALAQVLPNQLPGGTSSEALYRAERVLALGTLRVRMPAVATQDLAAIRFVNLQVAGQVQRLERPGPETDVSLPAGDYNVSMIFEAPGPQLNRDAPYGPCSVTAGATNVLAFGAIRFSIDERFLLAVTDMAVFDQDAETLLVTKTAYADKSYLFEPVPAPPGTYKLAVQSPSCRSPVVVARDLVVKAGEITPCELNTGVRVLRPRRKDITGWNLVPSDKKGRPLFVRGDQDPENQLWAGLYMVLPGSYSLELRTATDPDPVLRRADILIRPGGVYDLQAELPVLP